MVLSFFGLRGLFTNMSCNYAKQAAVFFLFFFFFFGGMVGISFRLFLGEDRIDNVVIFMLQCYPSFFYP